MGGTAILIPARGGSRSIPRKNLVDLCGRPLIGWTIKQARASGTGKVFTTSDDDEIIHYARRYTEIVREPVRDGTTSMEDVIRYALKEMDPPQWLILLQPTSPLRLAAQISEALAQLQQFKADSLASVIHHNKFLWRFGNIPGISPIGHAKDHRSMRQDREPQFCENGSIYAMRVNRFQDEGTRFCGKTIGYIMPSWTSPEIDAPEDLDLVRLILADRLRQGKDGVRT